MTLWNHRVTFRVTVRICTLEIDSVAIMTQKQQLTTLKNVLLMLKRNALVCIVLKRR